MCSILGPLEPGSRGAIIPPPPYFGWNITKTFSLQHICLRAWITKYSPPSPTRFLDVPTALYLYSIGKMLMCFCIPPWDPDGLKSHGAGKNRNKKKSRQIWTFKKRHFFSSPDDPDMMEKGIFDSIDCHQNPSNKVLRWAF